MVGKAKRVRRWFGGGWLFSELIWTILRELSGVMLRQKNSLK